MNPSAIVEDTQAEADERKRKAAELDALIARVDMGDGPPFETVTGMLGLLFAARGQVEGVQAMDPSADFIQGGRTDRAERLWRIKSAEMAFKEVDGRGALLLWLHLRPRTLVKSLAIAQWEESVPLFGLYQHRAVQAFGLSRRTAVREYWAALEKVERFAWGKGWLCARMERKPRSARAYRRAEE